jgi:hypothetical protein
MTWHKYKVCYRASSPVHLGYHPVTKGIVTARTRYFVPARTHWGAYVSALGLGGSDQAFAELAGSTQNEYRFSCLFPAIRREPTDAGVPAYYLPRLSKPSRADRPSPIHLVPEWCYGEVGDDALSISESELRAEWLDSRMSTATRQGTAEHGSLHEIELLLPIGRETRRSLYFIGVMWSKTGSPPRLPETILFGGERNYGFGTCRSHSRDWDDRWDGLLAAFPDNPTSFRWGLKRPLLGHLELSPEYGWRGSVEVLSGREVTDGASGARHGVAHAHGLCLSPGGELTHTRKDYQFEVSEKGIWHSVGS